MRKTAVVALKTAWVIQSTAYMVLAFLAMGLGLVGIAGIIYVAVWLMFVGGITDLINIIKDPAPAHLRQVGVALGKIIFSPFVGGFLGAGLVQVLDKLWHEVTPWEESSFNKWLRQKDEEKRERAQLEYERAKWDAIPKEWAEQDRQFRPWSKEEERLLRSLVSIGAGLDQVASSFGRSESAISTRLNRLRELDAKEND